jgi:hypothetical protein
MHGRSDLRRPFNPSINQSTFSPIPSEECKAYQTSAVELSTSAPRSCNICTTLASVFRGTTTRHLTPNVFAAVAAASPALPPEEVTMYVLGPWVLNASWQTAPTPTRGSVNGEKEGKGEGTDLGF